MKTVVGIVNLQESIYRLTGPFPDFRLGHDAITKKMVFKHRSPDQGEEMPGNGFSICPAEFPLIHSRQEKLLYASDDMRIAFLKEMLALIFSLEFSNSSRISAIS